MPLLNIAVIVFALTGAIYLVLFLVGSVFGMHEDDNIDLSVGGTSRSAAAQRNIMKTVDKINLATRWAGFAALSLGAILAGMWIYSVVQNLLGH